MIHDLENNHPAAKVHHQIVLNGPKEAEAPNWARDLSEDPYEEDDDRRYPLYFRDPDSSNYRGCRSKQN